MVHILVSSLIACPGCSRRMGLFLLHFRHPSSKTSSRLARATGVARAPNEAQLIIPSDSVKYSRVASERKFNRIVGEREFKIARL